MVNRLLVNLRFPTTNGHTHSGLRVWVRAGSNISEAALGPMHVNQFGRVSGVPVTSTDLVSSTKPGTPGKGIGRRPTSVGQSAVRATPEPVAAPFSGRQAGCQCRRLGQRGRNSHGSHVPPGSAGKPRTWRSCDPFPRNGVIRRGLGT
jgi:hypothetical protein